MALSTTRLMLKNYALHSIGKEAVDPTATERYERALENALKMLGRYRDWSFQQDVIDLVTTVPYSTGTVTIPSTTTVEFAGTTLPSDIVGQFLEFNGEDHWYEIVTRTDNDTLVTRNVYAGDLAAADPLYTYRIVYPLINLPANFKKHIALYDPERDDPLRWMPYEANWVSHSQRSGTGSPEDFSLIPKRHDPNQFQLMLYPAPDIKRIYQLAYFRQPGWFDTSTPATNTWKREATADTDYVDWPDDLMHVMRAAIQAAVAEEFAPGMWMQYQSLFELRAKEAAGKDQQFGQPKRLSRGMNPMLSGTKYTWS